MHRIVPVCLLVVALIHAIPVAGLLGPRALGFLYGFSVSDPNLELALRHRAGLFGILAAFLAYAAFHPPLHRLALVAGFASLVSFLVLAYSVGPLNQAMLGVVRADWFALLVLGVAAVARVRWPAV